MRLALLLNETFMKQVTELIPGTYLYTSLLILITLDGAGSGVTWSLDWEELEDPEKPNVYGQRVTTKPYHILPSEVRTWDTAVTSE